LGERLFYTLESIFYALEGISEGGILLEGVLLYSLACPSFFSLALYSGTLSTEIQEDAQTMAISQLSRARKRGRRIWGGESGPEEVEMSSYPPAVKNPWEGN
jgi:hypothetical protein